MPAFPVCPGALQNARCTVAQNDEAGGLDKPLECLRTTLNVLRRVHAKGRAAVICDGQRVRTTTSVGYGQQWQGEGWETLDQASLHKPCAEPTNG